MDRANKTVTSGLNKQRALWLLASAGFVLIAIFAFWPSPTDSSASSDTMPGRAARSGDRLLAKGSAPILADRQFRAPSLSKGRSAEHSAALALRELTTALELIQKEGDLSLRENRLNDLVSQVPLADLSSSLNLLNKSDSSDLSAQFKLRLLRRWAENDPRAAGNWASEIASASSRRDMIQAVAIMWTGKNFSEAADWARQLPGEEDRLGALTSVAYETARTEPLNALKLASELPVSEARADLIAHSTRQWAASTPEAAAQWAAQIAEPELRERVLSDIATVWSQTDALTAANFAVKSLSPGRPQNDAVISIIQRWTRETPEHATAWVMEFPEGALRDTALEEIVKLRTDQSVEKTESWLKEFKASAGRDTVIGAFVTKIAPQHPQLAAQWTKDIQDENLRREKMEAVGEAWIGTDPTAARAWIDQTPLPEKVKTRLRSLQSGDNV